MAFKLVGTLTEGAEPFKYLPITADEAYTKGEALVVTSGKVTKCGATTVPQYICQKTIAANAEDLVPCVPVRETDEYEVYSTATIAATALGGKVTLHTDGLSVTATTTSGVFRLKKTDGETTNSKVVGVFEV